MDRPNMAGVRGALAAGGIDVEAAVASGALVLATKDETYMRRGSSDPEWMFTYWREAAEAAEREGFTSLRATGETEWVVRGGPGLERWMEYESRLTQALAGSNAFALCQYNRRLYPPELIMDVIRTHPIVIYRDTVCRNFYFVPPDEYLGGSTAGRAVERLLNNIRDRERVDDELRRAQAELEQRVRDQTRELRESERTARQRNAVLEGVNRVLSEALSAGTEEELGRKCLEVAQAVTHSKFGFLGEISANGRLDDIAISDTGWSACAMESPAGHRQLAFGLDVHGIYGRVLLDGRGFFTNSPETHPDRVGVPEGHPGLTSFLGAPLIQVDKTIGMLGMANAEGGYTAADLEGLESLAAAVVQVFLRKRAETAARDGDERLRQAQKMESIGVLAGGVAHDFNNLLVGVIGNASLLDDMLPPGDPARPLLRGILKGGEQAAYLTRQLLAYAGKGGFIRQRVNVSSLVADARELIQGAISKRISLRFELAAGLPGVHMDASQMHQILMNLVSNAGEAIGDGAGAIEITSGLEQIGASDARLAFAQWNIRPGPCVFLEVRDTGCGMDESTLARIFEPFFTTKFQGRGLGLSAVAGIVRTLDGAIRVETSPGRGSAFKVLLPASAADSGAATPPRERATDGRARGRVLIVDDEELVRDMAGACLARTGFETTMAQSGAEAIDIFARERGRIDVVLLDLGMPGLSGPETLHRLREIRSDAAVILSSGHTEDHALSHFVRTDVAGFIQKPYTSKELAEMVGRVCRVHGARK